MFGLFIGFVENNKNLEYHLFFNKYTVILLIPDLFHILISFVHFHLQTFCIFTPRDL